MIHGEMLVPKFLELNGPSGAISKPWWSRADQAFTRTQPKMWVRRWQLGGMYQLHLVVAIATGAARWWSGFRVTNQHSRSMDGCTGEDEGGCTAVVGDQSGEANFAMSCQYTSTSPWPLKCEEHAVSFVPMAD